MVTVYAPMRDALLVARGDPDPDGGTWETDRRLTDHDLECVGVHPERPETVLVGTFDAGLHRSTDGGASFERVGTETLEERVTATTATPRDPDEWWVGTEPSAVFRSTDGGETWTEREGLTDLPSADGWAFPPRPHTHHVRWIEVDPHDPDRLFVSVEAGALVRSHDRGETWEDRVASARRDNHSLATHPDAPGRVWAAAGDGYAESDDGGDAWSYPQQGLDHRYCWSVAVDAADPDLVLVSAASGAYRAHTTGRAESYVYRKEGGEPWERLDGRGLPTGEGVLRASLAAGSAAGEFYALTNRGCFRTVDAGDDWTRQRLDWDEAFQEQTARGLAVVD